MPREPIFVKCPKCGHEWNWNVVKVCIQMDDKYNKCGTVLPVPEEAKDAPKAE